MSHPRADKLPHLLTNDLLYVCEQGLQLLPSDAHLGPAERAGSISIMVREVNAEPVVSGGSHPKQPNCCRRQAGVPGATA